MSNTFFIRGTISVQVEGGKPTIWISPCVGFLTPDKRKVIAFPVPFPEGEVVDAKLIKWSDEKQYKFEFKAKAKAIITNIPSLLVIAAQQKPIELRLDSDLNIVGFIFPAPSDHAHGC